MKYVKMLVISVVAALCCCASVVAASASAEGGPLWGYCKLGHSGPLTADCTTGTETGFEEALLQAGETLLLSAEGLSGQGWTGQELVALTPEYTIDCTNLEGHGWLLGGTPGLGQGKIVYSGCSLPNKPKCDVSTGGGPLGTITTNQLEAELVYLTEADAKALNPDESGTLFRPVGGAGNFVTIELHLLTATEKCPVNGSAAVKGQVLTYNDQPLAKVLLHTILAKKPALETYFEGKSGTKKTVKQLEIAGIFATYLGNDSLDVAELHGPSVAWWICP